VQTVIAKTVPPLVVAPVRPLLSGTPILPIISDISPVEIPLPAVVLPLPDAQGAPTVSGSPAVAKGDGSVDGLTVTLSRPLTRSFPSPDRPTSPIPPPTPTPPRQPIPVTTTSATDDGSLAPLGSGSFGILPPLGLLLPALMVVGIILGRSRSPGLLFDARFLPPG
jgi:hypothetical protein